MKKSIDFVSSVTSAKTKLRFLIIDKGQRIGFGQDAIADQPKVACEMVSAGAARSRVCVVNASELAALDGTCIFAPFPGTGMSGADAAKLKEWVIRHLDRIKSKEDAMRRWGVATDAQIAEVLRLARVSERYANSDLRCLPEGIQSRLTKAVLQVVPAPELRLR